MDDTELVERCRQGDAQAWAALVHRYERVVGAIASRAGLDNNAAADVFQTVFMRLFEHLHKLTEPDRLRAWIITTTRREASRQRGLAARIAVMTAAGDTHELEQDREAHSSHGQDPQDSVEHWQRLVHVQQGIERLSLRCQQLLQALFIDEDGDYSSVSRRLEMPIGSIGPTRARCLERLRQMVE